MKNDIEYFKNYGIDVRKEKDEYSNKDFLVAKCDNGINIFDEFQTVIVNRGYETKFIKFDTREIYFKKKD